MEIVGVDPGKTTGVAWYHSKTQERSAWETDWISAVDWVEGELPYIGALVIERFIPRPGAYSFQPDAMYAIGALTYLAAQHDHVSLVLQSPADAKRFSTDDKLRKIGWFTRTAGGHANDAVRHVLLYCVKRGIVDNELFVD